MTIWWWLYLVVAALLWIPVAFFFGKRCWMGSDAYSLDSEDYMVIASAGLGLALIWGLFVVSIPIWGAVWVVSRILKNADSA